MTFKKNYKKGGQTERIWRQTSVHMSFGGTEGRVKFIL